MNGPDNLLDAPLQGPPLPEVQNHTCFPSQYFQMFDVEDQAFHVLVTRITYDMTRLDDQGVPQLAEIQTPLVDADCFYGEPNVSSIIQESDFAPYKPRCDIVFSHATAYAPNGKETARWPVGVRVGSMEKRLAVAGPRQLTRGLLGWSLGEPAPALEVPVRFDLAFGGTCRWPEAAGDDDESDVLEHYLANPVGRGYAHSDWLKKANPRQMPAPQIEVFDKPFTERDANRQSYPSIGLGPVGRWWQGRIELAGTYDEEWKKNRWPRLPLDFDFAYWNCAPADQQIAYPEGGEEVVIVGLQPTGPLYLRLPKPEPKLLLHVSAGVPLFKMSNVDTVIFDMAAMRLVLVQRTVISAKAEVEGIEVGNWDIEAARAENARRMGEAEQRNRHG